MTPPISVEDLIQHGEKGAGVSRNHGSADNAHRRRPSVADVTSARARIDAREDAAVVAAVLEAVDRAAGRLGPSRVRLLLIQAGEAL